MAGKPPAQIMLLSMKILPNLEDFATRKIPILLGTFSPNRQEKPWTSVQGFSPPLFGKIAHGFGIGNFIGIFKKLGK